MKFSKSESPCLLLCHPNFGIFAARFSAADILGRARRYSMKASRFTGAQWAFAIKQREKPR
jgi:hypothetical protein